MASFLLFIVNIFKSIIGFFVHDYSALDLTDGENGTDAIAVGGGAEARIPVGVHTSETRRSHAFYTYYKKRRL